MLSRYMSFISLATFISRYIIVFDAVESESVLMISFSIYLLLVYRKATDFLRLILYPGSLLKFLIVYKSFLFEFGELLM